AAVPCSIRDVLRAQRGRARDDEGAELEAADHGDLPRRHPGKHHHERRARRHAEPGERVHEAVGRLLEVPERPAFAPPGVVLPVERDPAPVRGPGIDQRAEVELLGDLPAKPGEQLLIRAARRDHMLATRPRRAEAWMYLRETGERSSGARRASITANRGWRSSWTSASRSSSMRSTQKPRPPQASPSRA